MAHRVLSVAIRKMGLRAFHTEVTEGKPSTTENPEQSGSELLIPHAIHNSAFITSSLISQRFDGMKVGGAEGGRESAQKANDQKDDGGNRDRAQRNRSEERRVRV